MGPSRAISRRGVLAGIAGTLASVSALSRQSFVGRARAQQASSGNWRQPQADTGQTNALLAGTGPTGPVSEVWSGQYGRRGPQGIAVVDGTAYVAGTSLTAVDATDGSQQWTFTPTAPPNLTTEEAQPKIYPPAVVDGTVYATVGFDPLEGTGIQDAILIAVDAHTGKLTWRRETRGATEGFPSPVTVANETVFANLPERPLTAYSAADGQVLWRRFDTDETQAPGPVADGQMYLPSDGRGVRALDEATGDVVWTALPEVQATPELVAAGTLFVTAETATEEILIALDTVSGTEHWRTAYPSNGDTSGLAVGTADTTTVYSRIETKGSDEVSALDRTDGTERWRMSFADRPDDQFPATTGGMARVGDLLYVGSTALDPADGTIVWTYRNSEAPAPSSLSLEAVAGGRCYLLGAVQVGAKTVVLEDTHA